ncbi:hypothetical protein [Nodosilinea sp. FACHB-13]|uniref:hypothetical protein n=1 Tax=Cyanophyceae TaxID=3028117 RepID=UPI001689AA62|nr:hypothetical protein [Nodosilinea sp. FACHB-13]MBD2105540.1 hypothetical protein [Nodosilinea sp. FACHB-13]
MDPEKALWAPIHAWRSLGQLQAVEAIQPLAQVLQQHDKPKLKHFNRSDLLL